MIEIYKILTGKYDVDVAPKVLRVYDSTTRGNMFKLNKGRPPTCAHPVRESTTNLCTVMKEDARKRFNTVEHDC